MENKKSRFGKLGAIKDSDIIEKPEIEIPIKDNNDKEFQTMEPAIFENKSIKEKDSGLKFQKKNKTEFKLKGERKTINISEDTRDRLKVFCATNKVDMQIWADEQLWKAMDRHEKKLEK